MKRTPIIPIKIISPFSKRINIKKKRKKKIKKSKIYESAYEVPGVEEVIRI